MSFKAKECSILIWNGGGGLEAFFCSLVLGERERENKAKWLLQRKDDLAVACNHILKQTWHSSILPLTRLLCSLLCGATWSLYGMNVI